MRNRFERQLNLLNEELLDMCRLCESIIDYSLIALSLDENENEKYIEAIKLVNDTEKEINNREKEIEALCMRLLLQQQPVATDLRRISSALKMISDLERIGDQAYDIAELSEYIRHCKLEHKLHLKEMSLAVKEMVKQSIDSFVQLDLDMARQVRIKDNEVDAYFSKVKKELISIISKDDTDAELCVDLLMVSKYFERIGDHAENIAGWVEYSITGGHK
jgi:phosphate transport system protein